MTRPLRIQFEDACYHVTCRGNARQDIFLDDSDRLFFLGLLQRSSEIYQVRILAYALMTNHFHLLVKTPLANLQEFMRHFNISYTSHFNKNHRRVGHLYQGRYKSFLIDADNYLMEVSRYIHLNPVRVRAQDSLSLTERQQSLNRYPWSSYPGYISESQRKSLITYSDVLHYFGDDNSGARQQYAQFVEDGLSEDIESPLAKGKGHGIIGTSEFIERIKNRFLDRDRDRELPAVKSIIGYISPETILSTISEYTGVPENAFLKKGYKGGIARVLAMELLYRYGWMNQREIGALMGIDYSAVSVGRARFRKILEKDKELLRLHQRIKSCLIQG
ncbi:MAG: transposase [Thermodesulfobacteriota bacterium]|nr:transposase [Thermodesulfobacteriota bacterium]